MCRVLCEPGHQWGFLKNTFTMAINLEQINNRIKLQQKTESGLVKFLLKFPENYGYVEKAMHGMMKSKIYLSLTISDMGTKQAWPNNLEEYNFDSEEYHKQIDELCDSMDADISATKELYRSAYDTKVPEEGRAMFFTHLITAITAVEEAKMWLQIEREAYFNVKNAG
jgi:hypothetical protein